MNQWTPTDSVSQRNRSLLRLIHDSARPLSFTRVAEARGAASEVTVGESGLLHKTQRARFTKEVLLVS